MNPESWTNDRLKKLFNYYDKKYWNGKLPDVVVKQENTSENTWWRYFHEDNHIEIYVAKIKTDKEVRGTLLHEMCHLAAGKKSFRNGGHDSRFFTQVENLLKQKAPIDVGHAENPNSSWHFGIPKRFPLCRAEMKKENQRCLNQIERTNRMRGEEIEVEDGVEAMLRAFEDVVGYCPNISWREVLMVVGRETSMLDIDDKVLPWAKPHMKEAERKFREAKQNCRAKHNRSSRVPL